MIVHANTDAPIDYDEIDPGVRRLVRLLRDNGFETCDSGDGVSKYADAPEDDEIEDGPVLVADWAGCAEPVANVYMQIDPARMVSEAHRLEAILERHGRAGLLAEEVDNAEAGQPIPRVMIEVTYSPRDGHAILALHGVLDEDLLPVPS